MNKKNNSDKGKPYESGKPYENGKPGGKGKPAKGKATPKPYIKKEKPRPIEGNRIMGDSLQQIIFDLYQKDPRARYDPKHVITIIGVRNNVDSVRSAMDKLEQKGILTQTASGRFKLASQANLDLEGKQKLHEGLVDMTMQGSAFIVVEGREKDIFVSERNMNSALNGDIVRVALFARDSGKRPEGEVVEVVKRAASVFVGTLQVFPKFAFAVSDKDNMVDIFVPLSNLNEAQDGDKVVVSILKWHDKREKNPVGEVILVLGEEGSNDVAMKSILINAGFDLVFPPEALAEAEALSADISDEELADRRDMRSVTTFTIDPTDAKDFDDAISYELLPNGNIEVGVHIADVSHYVRPSTSLDEVAYKRSTSVYLVDRVLPMLPEKISNGLCSLRPHEDKRTFSVIFEFDAKNELVSRWIGKTYTHSDRRFTYDEAQAVLETGEGDFAAELRRIDDIAIKLRKAKFKNGAINFESPEVKFRLDENAKPIDIYLKERKEANLLIEDFMLLANRAVAEFIEDLQKDAQEVPYVYRVHDDPNEEKLADFGLFAQSMGIKMNLDTPRHIAESFNRLVLEAETRDEIKMLMPLAIRTMSKAAYSTNNIGHYGLAFSHYSHFTSPIRRYSDVLAHRILYKNLVKPVWRVDKATLEARCQHISKMERAAMDAERQSTKYKQAEFLADHVGKTFEGIISGLNEKAIFIELKQNFCEGRVSMESLKDDYYHKDTPFSVKGQNTGKVYRMGDTIMVLIKAVDIERRQIDMQIIAE